MNMSEELDRLQKLHESGGLTDDEYAQAKAKVLSGQGTGFGGFNVDVAEREKLWRIALHLSQFAGYLAPLAGFVLPIVLWQVLKEDYPSLDAHGRRVANWVFSYLIYMAVSVCSILLWVGVILVPLVAVLGIVFPLLGAIKASEGKCWKYPMSIEFFRVDE